jgi:serine protease Do
VNIRGSKTVADDAAAASLGAQQMKQVSGMGTGVVIDSRGYILTNYHVVQDVSQIRVTTFDRETVSGQIVARDPRTDLALIKVHTEKPLPIVPIGSSDSVMLAESVAAIGNAYGYEHTVTEGIVSELGRTVQVSDDQVYYDLIQTDAAINPGNSGGPLLNLKGEMIGINVAVRVGAQGIAFAIPINDAIDVAAELLRGIGDGQADCGFEVCTKYDSAEPATVVTAIAAGSSAEKSGLKVGDQLTSIDDLPCTRAIDVFRAMLGGTPDGELKVCFRRGETAEIAVVKLERASPKQAAVPPPQLAWDSLGIEVVPVDREAMRRINPSYDGGLRVAQVRPGSPAERENLRVGDVIVAMAEWKTESIENLNYILRQPEIQSRKYFKFYIFRNDEPLFGQIRIAQAAK